MVERGIETNRIQSGCFSEGELSFLSNGLGIYPDMADDRKLLEELLIEKGLDELSSPEALKRKKILEHFRRKVEDK